MKKLLVSPIVLIGVGFLFVGAMAELVVCWVDRLCDWAEK